MLNNTLEITIYKSKGFLASDEGCKLLRRYKKQLSQRLGTTITYKYMANQLFLSEDTIKNFFNPQLQRPVGKLSIEEICEFLQIEPIRIIDQPHKWYN